MAKSNNNYFKMCIDQNGGNEDFLANKTNIDIQKDARRRIFNDIVFGNIDYAIYGKYFMDSRFLDQLIVESENEKNKHLILLQSLDLYDQANPGSPIAFEMKRIENAKWAAFSAISDTLKMVRENNYNVGYLTNLTNYVYKYRQDFVN